MKMTILGSVLAGSTLLASIAQAEDTISAVHAFPETLIYTKSFLSFVDKVNAAGEGVVQIDVRGGPEAIGMFQQPDAVRDGVVDMVYTPGSFYGGSLPEKDAMVTSNMTAVEARASGGIALIDEIHQAKMGLKYLGWFDSGVCYNLWTRDKPKFDAEGNFDVDGLKLRGNNVYNAFFSGYLNAQVIDLPTGEVYSALQRGVVDATGWTQIGLIDLKWNEFLNYRIEPCFFSTDLGVIINQEKWESLSEESRTILQDVAIQHETTTVLIVRRQRRDAQGLCRNQLLRSRNSRRRRQRHGRRLAGQLPSHAIDAPRRVVRLVPELRVNCRARAVALLREHGHLVSS